MFSNFLGKFICRILFCFSQGNGRNKAVLGFVVRNSVKFHVFFRKNIPLPSDPLPEVSFELISTCFVGLRDATYHHFHI